jgi:hypothetical protein
MNEFMKAWNVSEKDFPREGTAADKLAFCLRYAILAPSTYNVQPWYFKISDSSVSVYIDRRYGLPVIDPDDREISICCATSLFNLRLAIRYFGYKEVTELLPDPSDEDLIARVKLVDPQECDDNDKMLFKAITKRHSNQGAFSDKEVPEETLRSLQAAASKEGAWLHICSETERQTVSRMIIEADHTQITNKNFRRELASWICENRERSGDGMPNLGLGYHDVVNNISPNIFRRFESDRDAVTDQELEQKTPVLAVLGCMSGSNVERIYTGQGLMRLWLLAENEGLSISTLNQACEIPEFRLRLHDEIEHQGRVQMILRIGYGGKPVYTPRRCLSSVLEIKGRSPLDTQKVIANDQRKERKIFGRFRKLFIAK